MIICISCDVLCFRLVRVVVYWFNTMSMFENSQYTDTDFFIEITNKQTNAWSMHFDVQVQSPILKFS